MVEASAGDAVKILAVWDMQSQALHAQKLLREQLKQLDRFEATVKQIESRQTKSKPSQGCRGCSKGHDGPCKDA